MPSHSPRFVPALLLAAALSSVSYAKPKDDAAFDQVDAYVNGLLEKKRTPSYSIAIVKDGKVVHAKGYGFADLENEIPASPETVYRLGSITKQFTASMIMQLVGEGKLKLDDPFSKTLTDLPKAWDKVTVRQLLNHTSGIKSYTEIKDLFSGEAMRPTTPAGIVKTVEKDPLDFEPGSQWHYNNTGYELLGMLIEKLDGRPYSASLKARITDPLGMNNTFFVSERALVKHRAQGYSVGKSGFEHAAYLNMDWPYAAGSIESTVLDLAKWDAALYGDKILPQSTLAQMWTATTLTDGKKAPYGFGWQIGSMNGIPLVEHGGGIHGFTTHIRRAPSKGITVIVLSNSDGGGDPAGVAKTAMGLVEPTLKEIIVKAPVDKDPKATAFAKETLQSILDGKLDKSKLTPEFAKLVTPEMEKGVKEDLGGLGKLSDFEYFETTEKAGTSIRTYRFKLGDTVFKMDLIINEKGLIAGLNLHQ